MPQKQESPWNFWSRLKILGAHCVLLDVILAFTKCSKYIFFVFQHNPEDTETIHKAAKALRSKSESGYRGLVRLLNKYGYLHVLLESNGQNVDDNSSDPTKNRASSSSQ